jgi:hypothetical protein
MQQHRGQYCTDAVHDTRTTTYIAFDLGLNGNFEMGLSHLFPSIYYGLMHGTNADGSDWNVFDRNLPR